MTDPVSLDSRELELVSELMEARTSSLDLEHVLSRTYSVLSKLLAADYSAVCVSKPGRPTEYEWMAEALPSEFFQRYPKVSTENFVLDAARRHPDRALALALRDAPELREMYQRARELRMPVEHVLAVALDIGRDVHGGFFLYRERKEPFSQRELALLQRLTPILASTLHSIRLLSDLRGEESVLSRLLLTTGIESIVVRPPATELLRTPQASALLKKWFSPLECSSQGLPIVLLERLAWLNSSSGSTQAPVPNTWVRPGHEQFLKVTFVPLPRTEEAAPWALLFQEAGH
jgi:GAF domain-containing protein